MINLYQLLNISPNADAATIQTIVQHAQAAGKTDPRVIKAAQEWLLKPEVRTRYDAQLRQKHPEFFTASVPQSVAHFARPTPKIEAFAVAEPDAAPPIPPTSPTHATPDSTNPPVNPSANPAKRRHKTPVQAAIAQQAAYEQQEGVVTLWNPQVAVYWSILFNVAFGAALHALNWQRLGNQKLAQANWLWLGIYLVWLIASMTLINDLPMFTSFLINIALIVAWVFTVGKKQTDYVKQELNEQYHKRGWVLPIVITIGLFFLYGVIYGLLFGDTLTQYE